MMLIYHGIDQKGSTKFNSRFISQDYFDKQLAYFKAHFNVITLEEYYNREFDHNRLNLCLTFDDGYLNNLKYALPVLEKHQIPAAFYITTIRNKDYDHLWADYLDMAAFTSNSAVDVNGERFVKGAHGEYYSSETGISMKITCKNKNFKWKDACMRAMSPSFKENHHLDDYWKLMDEKDIQKLDESDLVTIGSHGQLHDCLGVIELPDACADIQNSKDYLESVTGHKIDSIAFPDGSYTREVVDFCDSIGLEKQLAVGYLFNEDHADKRLVERFGINPYISWHNQMNCILKHKYL